MKSLFLNRGARFCCALTSLYAAALWMSAPALAAGGSDNAFGQNTALHLTKGGRTHVNAGSLSGTLVRTIVGLLIVIAVIYGVAWLMRQARAARNPTTGDGLTQIATLPLGPNRSVALVRVGAELHMLGVADHGITSIRVFNEEEAYELGLPFEPETGSSPGGAGAFSALGGRGGRGGREQAQSLIDSLRRMTIR
jgi:flagellar protein FliO/FliZ